MRPSSKSAPALSTGLMLAPVLHPLLIPVVGLASHLLWWIHVLPVALLTFWHGRWHALLTGGASVVLLVVGERLFGAGYGVPADWGTVATLAGALPVHPGHPPSRQRGAVVISPGMTPERFHRIKRVLSARQPDLTVLMERVNKTHNFSAILRNCDAVGVLQAHVVLPDQGIDLHHATSAGTSRWVPVEVHDDTAAAVTHLRDRGFTVLAAHPSERAVDYRDVDYTRPTAFMMGAELHGISPAGLEAADHHVVIPMRGFVQSLNVSVAAALLLFEAHRQRSRAGMYDAPRLPGDRFRTLLFEWAYPREAGILKDRGDPYPELDADGNWMTGPAGA